MMETLNINIFAYKSMCLARAIKNALCSKMGFKPGQRLLHLGDYSEHCLCMEMKLGFVPGVTLRKNVPIGTGAGTGTCSSALWQNIAAHSHKAVGDKPLSWFCDYLLVRQLCNEESDSS